MLLCPKCHAAFRKQARYDKHYATCKGKVCRNCGQIGHLSCGIALTSQDLKQKIAAAAAKGPVKIIGLF